MNSMALKSEWTAVCPTHGAQEIAQITKPTVCKILCGTGYRSMRQCRRSLANVARKPASIPIVPGQN